MKVTVDIPDAIFRRAKSLAAERGIPLGVLTIEALADKLRAENASAIREQNARFLRISGKPEIPRNDEFDFLGKAVISTLCHGSKSSPGEISPSEISRYRCIGISVHRKIKNPVVVRCAS
jgi:hypothetical protein